MVTGKGIPVLPLYQAVGKKCNCRNPRTCGNPGKHPRPKRGFDAASTDLNQIRSWFRSGRWECSNWAARTGRDSGLIVFDFDHRDGGMTTYAELVAEHPEVENTVIVNTAGGRHLWFTHPGGTIKSQVKVRDGVDVRGDGGMIIIPPSIHASGVSYRWLEGHSIQQIKIAPLPPSLALWLSSHHSKASGRVESLRCDTRHTQDNAESLSVSSLLKAPASGSAHIRKEPLNQQTTRRLDDLSGDERADLTNVVALSVPSTLLMSQRNTLAFNLGRRLRWGSFSDLDSYSRRQVFSWQYNLILARAAASAVSVKANVREHITDCERAFHSSHTPIGGKVEIVLQRFKELFQSADWPPQVLNAIDENYIERSDWVAALVLLCWAFHEVQNASVWFGSYRLIQAWLGRVIDEPPHHELVCREMKWLCDSRVVRMVKVGECGTLGRKKATEWLWTWVPSSEREQAEEGGRRVFKALFSEEEPQFIPDGGDNYYSMGF